MDKSVLTYLHQTHRPLRDGSRQGLRGFPKSTVQGLIDSPTSFPLGSPSLSS